MNTELIHIGFGNILAVNRVVAVVSTGASPTKRMVQDAKARGMTVDMTNGRRTKAVLIMDSGHIILAAITPETIANRLAVRRGDPGLRIEQEEVEIE